MKQQRHIRVGGRNQLLHAVAFDLDGTLTRPYLDFGRLRQQLDISNGDILKWVAELPPAEQAQALRIIEAFEQDGVAHAEWNDGASETLHEIRLMGLPVAIVTRNSRTSLEAVCRRLGIAADLLVGREDAPPNLTRPAFITRPRVWAVRLKIFW